MSDEGTRRDGGAGFRATAIVSVLALALLGVGLTLASGAAGDAVDRLEPIDDATPGQRSADEVCADEATCANATLESSRFECEGSSSATFACSVTYYVNLTVTGTDTCANASANASDALAVEACTGLAPVAYASSGPVTVTYEGTNASQGVDVGASVCLTGGSCEEWAHDPFMLPSWDEWRPKSSESEGEWTTHHVCLGDSESLSGSADPNPGCVTFMVRTLTECGGSGLTGCDLDVWVLAHPEGERLCGTTSSEFESGGEALACGFQKGGMLSAKHVGSRHYDADERYVDGPRTVVIEAEACAYVFDVDVTEYCETFYSVEDIPGHHCACGGTDGEKHRVDYWLTWANHTKPPGVYL